jgi:hypothetical protein
MFFRGGWSGAVRGRSGNRAGNAALSRPKASEKAAERRGVLFFSEAEGRGASRQRVERGRRQQEARNEVRAAECCRLRQGRRSFLQTELVPGKASA